MTWTPGVPQEKIGLGVITCDRPQLFRECIAGIPEVDELVVVNDGLPYDPGMFPSGVGQVIQHTKRLGVGRSKNDALRYLLRAGCTHLFLSEDDIRIINPGICREYLRASARSGILHFNFAYHGYENRQPDGTPAPPRRVVEYGDGVSIALHRNLLAAFQYFRADVLTSCGLFDPVFRNMLEHTDLTYRIIRHGYHPPYWWFADIADSCRYIEDLDPAHLKSTSTRGRLRYRIRFHLYDRYFSLKHGVRVGHVRDVSQEEVDDALAQLKRSYAVAA